MVLENELETPIVIYTSYATFNKLLDYDLNITNYLKDIELKTQINDFKCLYARGLDESLKRLQVKKEQRDYLINRLFGLTCDCMGKSYYEIVGKPTIENSIETFQTQIEVKRLPLELISIGSKDPRYILNKLNN